MIKRASVAVALVLALVPLTGAAAAATPKPLRFEERQDIGYPGPASVAIADVTGDGMADIAYSVFSKDVVTVHPQQADGSLGAPFSVATTSTFGNQQGIATGDLTGDGLTDLALANGDGVDIFKQASNTLSAPTHRTVDNVSTEQVEIAELSGDTLNDMVVTSNNGLYLIVKNAGPGWVTTSLGIPSSTELELGDVTGDGSVDIVVGAYAGISVYPNDGAGAFGPAASYATSSSVGGIALGDFNDNGRTDVAAAVGGNASSRLNVFPQRQDGTLGDRIVTESYDIPDAAESSDLNNDGRDDLVVTHGVWNAFGVYLQGDHGLGKETLYPIDYDNINPKALSLGDVNADGHPDVVWGDNTGALSIERQEADLELRAPIRVKQGADADWSLHLGPYATTTNSVVGIYASSGGGPFRLVEEHAVNANGNLSGTLTGLTRTTVLKAVWAGDKRSATVEAQRKIGVPADVTGTLTGFRSTSGAYKIYDAGDKPVYTAKVAPNNAGGSITFKLEKNVSGEWKYVDKLQTKLNEKSKAVVTITIKTGVRYRVDADFYGTKKNLGATSAWSYFKAT